MPSDVLEVSEPREGISVIHLNRPARLNALTPDLVNALVQTLSELGASPRCRVIVITGRGRGFCAGMDMHARADEERDGAPGSARRLNNQETYAAMARTIRLLQQPVIAAVNGPAAGAGFGIALACDIRIAAPEAQFHVAAIKLGLSSGECGISYHLPRYIGAARAFEVMLTGRPIEATEAERIGLVSRVVDADRLLDSALDIGSAIAAHAPFGVRQTKAVMWDNLDASFHSAIELENRTQIVAVLTEDAEEAIRSFVDKRMPTFTGR